MKMLTKNVKVNKIVVGAISVGIPETLAELAAFGDTFEVTGTLVAGGTVAGKVSTLKSFRYGAVLKGMAVVRDAAGASAVVKDHILAMAKTKLNLDGAPLAKALPVVNGMLAAMALGQSYGKSNDAKLAHWVAAQKASGAVIDEAGTLKITPAEAPAPETKKNGRK